MTARSGKTALITGGSAGMGRAIAQRFVDAGMRVLVTGRSPDSLADARGVLGERAEVVESDAGNPSDIAELSERVRRSFGTLDVLVLNAGRGAPTPFDSVTERDFDEDFRLNVKGPFFTAQAVGPTMQAGGAIVLTTSIGATMGRPSMSTYDASKAALRLLTRSLAAEFLPRGIRVNAVSPGAIDTTIIERSPLPEEVKADMREAMLGMVPMRRFGKPEEIAAAVDFLAFDATFTTGAELPVDGGWTQL
jgi:NAD(P)-dependent dehydrogenase (short-subunit alcohol dehydrogenase family)